MNAMDPHDGLEYDAETGLPVAVLHESTCRWPEYQMERFGIPGLRELTLEMLTEHIALCGLETDRSTQARFLATDRGEDTEGRATSRCTEPSCVTQAAYVATRNHVSARVPDTGASGIDALRHALAEADAGLALAGLDREGGLGPLMKDQDSLLEWARRAGILYETLRALSERVEHYARRNAP